MLVLNVEPCPICAAIGAAVEKTNDNWREELARAGIREPGLFVKDQVEAKVRAAVEAERLSIKKRVIDLPRPLECNAVLEAVDDLGHKNDEVKR